MTRVLFVCAGNICRSPMAEGILRKLLRERGLLDRFELDSAGTGSWHTGQPADPRTQLVLERQRANFPHSARPFEAADLERFDHILVMDLDNLHTLQRRYPAHRERFRLVMGLLGGQDQFNIPEVPDPYYGDLADFERVYSMLHEALTAFLSRYPPT